MMAVPPAFQYQWYAYNVTEHARTVAPDKVLVMVAESKPIRLRRLFPAVPS
jgi:hypothetical protein